MIFVCTNKRREGLGVRHVLSFNKVLLYKWSWCFAPRRDAFWWKVKRKGVLLEGGREPGIGLMED